MPQPEDSFGWWYPASKPPDLTNLLPGEQVGRIHEWLLHNYQDPRAVMGAFNDVPNNHPTLRTLGPLRTEQILKAAFGRPDNGGGIMQAATKLVPDHNKTGSRPRLQLIPPTLCNLGLRVDAET